MKKYLVCFFICCFTYTFSQQNSTVNSNSRTFGVKGGMNTSNVGGSDVESTPKYRKGFCAGLFLENQTQNSHISLQAELLYCTKGFRHEIINEIDHEFYELEYNLNCLELPFMIKYHFLDEKVTPLVYFGCSISYYHNPTADYLKLLNNGKFVVDNKDLPDSDPLDISIIGGCGFEMRFTKQILYLDVRYNHGMKRIPQDEIDGGSAMDIYNRVWSFTLGLSKNN